MSIQDKLIDILTEIGANHASDAHPEGAINADCKVCEQLTDAFIVMAAVDLGADERGIATARSRFDFRTQAEKFNARFQRGN